MDQLLPGGTGQQVVAQLQILAQLLLQVKRL